MWGRGKDVRHCLFVMLWNLPWLCYSLGFCGQLWPQIAPLFWIVALEQVSSPVLLLYTLPYLCANCLLLSSSCQVGVHAWATQRHQGGGNDGSPAWSKGMGVNIGPLDHREERWRERRRECMSEWLRERKGVRETCTCVLYIIYNINYNYRYH